MNKFIFILIVLFSFSFASNEAHEEDKYYASLNAEGETIITAHQKKKNKSPLRKRYLKRKRRVKNPAQGK